jgi:DNA polymerase III sliding clamp (beta) subunit (PCNA family)
VKKSGLATVQKHWGLVEVTDYQAEDWPELKYDRAPIELNQATISGMIDALVTVSKDETRPILNCIELKANGTITSTDSYRLLTKNGGHDLTALIPSKMVELVKMTKLMDNWYIGTNDEQIVMQNGNFTIVQRAIEGAYPDWTKLAPLTAARRVTVKSALVYEALDLIEDGNIRLDQNGGVYVQSGDREDSKRSLIAVAKPELNVKNNINNMHIVMPLKGDKREQVILNQRYVRDAVGKAEYMRFAFNGGLEPVVVDGVER